MSKLNHYNGTLYPLDEGWEHHWATERENTVKPLVDFCSENIVQDSSSTGRALNVIPHDLYYSLMKAALRLDRDRSLEILIASWPWPTLCLKKFAPKLFDNIKALHLHPYVEKRMMQGIKYTTCLAHTFVECLKKRTPTRLRCLDLTGYPTAEVIVNYLCSHALLVHNETRQREIISVYNEMAKNLPEIEQGKFTLDPTLPENNYVVRLDASLNDGNTHMELCRALRVSQNKHRCLRLEVSKLEMTCLGAARISVLLGEVNKESIIALSLQYNALSSTGVVLLGPELQKLPNLTSLDLSRNGCRLQQQTNASDMLADTLASLPQLIRLDMCSNWIRNSLRKLLSRVQKPLTYLKLCGCGLSKEDLLYLQNSHHASTLTVLDISVNVFISCASELLGLVSAISSTIEVLEMEDIGLTESDWRTIFSRCHLMLKLRYWSIALNTGICRDILVDIVAELIKIESIRAVRVSYPIDCWLSDDPDEIADEQQTFCDLYGQLIATSCLHAERMPIELIINKH